MIRVGIAGIGFMGWIHWLAYKDTPGVEVVAIWDLSETKRAGDWTSIKGNFGPAGEIVDLSAIRTYATLEEMLADEQIDVIDICLPPAFHHETAIQALAAKKHVFSEKPMSLWPEKCDLMVAAAKANDRLLMVAHVLPFFTEYAHARQMIDSGQYGKLIGGKFLRVISDPQWINGFYDPDKIGGPMLDLHVHDAHLIRLLYGMPTTVQSLGRVQGCVAKYWNSILGFEDPDVCVNVTCGVIDQQGRPFSHGFEIHLEKATLHFELAVLDGKVESMPLKVIADDATVTYPDLPASDDIEGFRGEIREMVRSVESGEVSQILGADLARDAIVLCQQQSDRVLAGQTRTG